MWPTLSIRYPAARMLAMDYSSSAGTAKTDHLAVDLTPTAWSAWRSFRCPVGLRDSLCAGLRAARAAG